MKILRARPGRRAALLRRGTLSYPGLVAPLGRGRTAEGQIYMAMELVRGENLRERLDARGRLPWRHAVAVDAARREARVFAELRHPAFPTLYDVHEHNGQLYLAMEFIQGERAGNFVQRPLCPAYVLAVGIQLADALVALHSLGVVHRDIHGSNVLLASLHPDPSHRLDASGLLARFTEATELQAAEEH